jgi:hypothetical protein
LASHIETNFEVLVLSLVIALILLLGIYTNFAFTQEEQATSTISIKITSHVTGQQVPVGEFTITGTSTDDTTSDCTVYADVNDIKPFQKAIATGPGGLNDYSTWNFTYTDNYHLITNGTNNLTSKLSCLSNPTNLTKWNSIDVIGEVSLTIPKNNVTSVDQRTSFEGQTPANIGNETENITDDSQINISLSNVPNNNNASSTMNAKDNATLAVTNNKTGNPIIDFFKGMFGS